MNSWYWFKEQNKRRTRFNYYHYEEKAGRGVKERWGFVRVDGHEGGEDRI